MRDGTAAGAIDTSPDVAKIMEEHWRSATPAEKLARMLSIGRSINALTRGPDGRWRGDIFDGIGCVEAFRRRGHDLKGKRVMLIGAGGAGAAVGVAIAYEHPASMRLFDLDHARAEALAAKIARVDPAIAAEIGAPSIDGRDVLVNASPVGMLADAPAQQQPEPVLDAAE